MSWPSASGLGTISYASGSLHLQNSKKNICAGSEVAGIVSAISLGIWSSMAGFRGLSGNRSCSRNDVAGGSWRRSMIR